MKCPASAVEQGPAAQPPVLEAVCTPGVRAVGEAGLYATLVGQDPVAGGEIDPSGCYGDGGLQPCKIHARNARPGWPNAADVTLCGGARWAP